MHTTQTQPSIPTIAMYPMWPVRIIRLQLMPDGETRARVRFFQRDAVAGAAVMGPREVDVDVHELHKFEAALRTALVLRAGSLHIEGMLLGIDAHEKRTGLDDDGLAAASGLPPGALAGFREEYASLLEVEEEGRRTRSRR